MYAFIYAHRAAYGVEPICRILEIAPSSYRAHKAAEADAPRGAPRAWRDEALRTEIRRVHRDNHDVYGACNVWRQLRRGGTSVARCTVERLMVADGLRGVVRGRHVRTTVSEPAAESPRDLAQRQFSATKPNELWVADSTYVARWRGFVHVAFVLDAFSRRIVGWRAYRTMRTDLVLDALEQALHDRESGGQLIHHSDRGSQYVSLRYTEWLAAAAVAPLVSSVGTPMTTRSPRASSGCSRPR